MSKYGRCRGWTRDGRIGLMVLVGVTWNITGQEFDKAWFWKVLWLDDMAVRALKKIGTCFLICIPGPLGFRPAKNMAVITWICATFDACESSWIIFFVCFLGYGWREMQEFSQIEQVFRKKWVARRTSTRWNTRYIIDPSSEMLWARIQYSRYIPGIFQVYSRYIPGI